MKLATELFVVSSSRMHEALSPLPPTSSRRGSQMRSILPETLPVLRSRSTCWRLTCVLQACRHVVWCLKRSQFRRERISVAEISVSPRRYAPVPFIVFVYNGRRLSATEQLTLSRSKLFVQNNACLVSRSESVNDQGSGLPARAYRLKIFTLNRKARVSVAEWLRQILILPAPVTSAL